MILAFVAIFVTFGEAGQPSCTDKHGVPCTGCWFKMEGKCKMPPGMKDAPQYVRNIRNKTEKFRCENNIKNPGGKWCA